MAALMLLLVTDTFRWKNTWSKVGNEGVGAGLASGGCSLGRPQFPILGLMLSCHCPKIIHNSRTICILWWALQMMGPTPEGEGEEPGKGHQRCPVSWGCAASVKF